MKKAFVSMLLFAFAIHLAVAADAEGSITRLAARLGTESTAEDVSVVTEAVVPEQAQVGRIETVPVVFETQSGEQAQSVGETPSAEIVETTIKGDISIRNDTSIEIDLEALAAEGIDLSLSPDGPQILIIHTHGSEAYTQSPDDIYIESDPYRTEDCEKNVIKVGDVLTEKLEEKGLWVIHDKGIYDYPSYTGSYSRSGASVEAYLAEYPTIEVVIDLHRDALGSGDTVYKTRAETSEGNCAQVMLLVGTGENGLYHPLWEQNLKLALYLQSAMDEAYPTLARPLSLKSERYNQHLSPGSLIIEVGSTGNTLAEAIGAIELFADAAGDALVKLVENE